MEKDHLEILLEDMNSKVELIVQGQASLHAEMRTMRKELVERIDQVEFKIDVLNKKVDARPLIAPTPSHITECIS